MSEAATATANGHLTGFGGKPYRTYVLLTLTLVYTLNFIDRVLISVIGRPIVEEFSLSNTQFGLLTGIGFALFYTLLGIPIASLSERYNRVRIIGTCVILWSAATVLCGFAGGFISLLFFRMLVGVGEAGCTPPANSLISDYYKPQSRATALGIYAIGVTAGGLLAQLFGGTILNFFSWREAFIYVGAPGVIIGLLLLLTVKEPPRGYSDPPNAPRPEKASFGQAIREISSKPTFWVMAAGATLAAFSGYALVSFQPLHVQYTHDYSAAETAIRFMAPIALFGSLGAFLGGWLTEQAQKSSLTAPCWVPGIAFLLCGPIYATAFLLEDTTHMFIALCVAGLLQYFYLGAQYNIAQSVVSIRARATSIAILLFIVNLIGYGVGPLVFGVLADIFTTSYIQATDQVDTLTVDCSTRDETIGVACTAAKAYGIKYANTIAAAMFVLAGLFFLLSARTFRRDTTIGPVAAAES